MQKRRWETAVRSSDLTALGQRCASPSHYLFRAYIPTTRPGRTAEILAKEGIEVEVVDLRSIRPLDTKTILNSVRKTGRLIVADGAWKFLGLSAEVITSSQTNREQEVIMSRFKAGEFQIAVTVDMFNEGVDVPDVDMVVFLRATHSRRIFVQQLGRGLRISPEKDKVIVLDFVSDLRRMAMVLELDKSVKSLQIEKLGLGDKLVEFKDESAGTFLKEWLLDQADLLAREGDAKLEIPKFDYPEVEVIHS